MTEDLEHFGVKGMHWGVRKEQTSGYRLQAHGAVIDSNLHPSTKQGASDVAKLMGSRYGFQITEVKTLGPGHPEYVPGAKGTMAFVQSTPGKAGGIIYAKALDLRKEMGKAEKDGWFAPGCGNPRALLTHESAHALFHAPQEYKTSYWTGKTKVSGGNQEARDKAIKAALKVAKEDGIEPGLYGLNFASHVSGYAQHARVQEEIEAEMFSQYHWSPNPPRFIKAWGETLHQELGVDPTPFRKTVKGG